MPERDEDSGSLVSASERLAKASAGQTRDVLREHAFDDIREYDNEVPRWLAWIFYASVVWGVLYVGHYHLGDGSIGAEAYRQEMIAVNERLAEQSEGIPPEDVLRQLSHNDERIAAGEKIFFGAGQCVQCHGQDGLGLAGPNLRDDQWVHGSDMAEIIGVIADGAAQGQMPAHRDKLSQQDLVNLAAYIADWNRSAKQSGGVHRDGEEHDPIGD